MNDIREKYQQYREVAKDGDILLWYGDKFMARAIRFFDDNYVSDAGEKIKDQAYYTHSSIIFWGRGKRLQNADSWYRGITVVPASDRVSYYNDFCVLRPKMNHVLDHETQMEVGIKWIMDKWESHVKYDYFNVPRVALIKKTGIDITGLAKRSDFICSEFTQAFTLILGIKDYYRRLIFTPQDHIRFNAGSFEVLFDNKLIVKQ